MVERFVSDLAVRSSLTGTQLETLALHRRVRSGELSSIDAASLRHSGPVRLGSYYRVLSQAKANLQRSIFTVLLGTRMGVVKNEDLRRLFDLVVQPAEMDDETSERVIEIIDALIERLVVI